VIGIELICCTVNVSDIKTGKICVALSATNKSVDFNSCQTWGQFNSGIGIDGQFQFRNWNWNIYFIELSKEEHLKYTCIEYIIHKNIISI
jgi:hypothetical protein